jgi:hypothetical protein
MTYLGAIAATAGEILNENTIVFLPGVYEDSVIGSLHRIMPVQIFDGVTDSIINFAKIDLDEFNFPEQSSQLDVYVTDWVRDRILFADTRQAWVPDYHVLDLRTRTVYRPQSDILDQVFGSMFTTPSCRYIIYFAVDYDLMNRTGENYLQNHDIMFTTVIDAETFMRISRLDAFSANMNSPSNFFFSGDTILYISNPFVGLANQQLARLSLPSLSILDTLYLNQYCSPPCLEAFICDVGNDLAVFYAKYAKGDTEVSAYKAVSTIGKEPLGEMSITDMHQQSPAKASPDGQFIVCRAPGSKIEVFTREFAKLYEIAEVAGWHIVDDGSGNMTLIVIPVGSEQRQEYDISSGRLKERR